jgi:hypothetical protein
MQLDEIFELWAEDSNIDTARISEEAIKIPKLHHKYYKIFSQERLTLKKYETDFKKLHQLKFEYFLGTLSQETLKENGWAPNPRSILKGDIPLYIESDQDIINLTLKIGLQKEKVSVLESVIKNISERGYMIKNYIEWQKFTNGTS